MDRSALNIDILLLILSLADDSPTKLALMSTSQVLYREGGKLFLKTTPVWINSEPQLTSFLQFMNADQFSRTRHLRGLTIAIKTPSRPVTEALESMFRRLTMVSQLESLGICHSEDFLCAHPPLSHAISELTSLQAINFYHVGIRSLKILESMRSNLESVDIELGALYNDLENEADGDMTQLLRQSSSTLRSLSVSCGFDTADAQDRPRYPVMRSLTLENPCSPITWHCVRAFPNLEDLRIPEGGMDEAEDAGLSEFRAMNVSLLHRHGSWQSLDTFEGPVSMLWILGLQCPIRVLDVSIERYDNFVPDMLRDVLRSSRPTELKFTFRNFTFFRDPTFTAVFAESCPPDVKELMLTLDMNNEWDIRFDGDPGPDLPAIVVALTDMLRSFSTLEDLWLYIRIVCQNQDNFDDLLPAELFARYIDAEATFSALRDALPSANKVRLTLIGRKRGDADRAIVQLEA